MNNERNKVIETIRTRYIPIRITRVEPEFIDFEEQMASVEDLKRILDTPLSSLSNPHNSILLYVIGLTDELDFSKGVDTIDGSWPDLDLDFETQNFQTIVDSVVEQYGRDNVASIATLSKFKPKSIVNKFFNVTAPSKIGLEDNVYQKKLYEHFQIQREILEMIPDALFGKEPTLAECVDGNSKKGYKPHPELANSPRYRPWYEVAKKLEGMVNTYSIHAAGLVITDFPTYNVCPTTMKQDKDEVTQEIVQRRITQMPMDDIAELGLCKFDFLRIENLSIVKECCKLIEQRHGKKIEPYKIPDFDKPAYDLMASGQLGGVFQLEASQTTKDYTRRMKPESISETSDVSALVRPGPLQAGLTEQYIRNKEAGCPPDDLHPIFADVCKDSYWVLTYQEQVMKLLSLAAGFSLQEADDVRRAIG